MEMIGKTWRPSRYILPSKEVFAGRDGQRYRVVYSTRSGTLAAVPLEKFTLIERNMVELLTPTELEYLAARQIIVDSDEDEIQAVIAQQSEASDSPKQRRFAILPTSLCNMGCDYCGQEHRPSAPTAAARAAVVRRVTAALDDPECSLVEVNWFGGEPLVGKQVILSLGDEFRRRAEETGTEYRSAIVTNGSLLTVALLVDLHERAGITRVEVTLDGPPDVHDRRRPMKSGQPTFSRIVRVLAASLRTESLAELTFSVRTNVDERNIAEILSYVSDPSLELLRSPRVSFYFAPVHPWGNDLADLIPRRRRYADAEVAWMTKLLERGLNVGTLPQGPVGIVCSAVTRRAELDDPTGRVFSCSEQPLVPSRAGTSLADARTLDPGALRPTGMFDGWHTQLVRGEVPCRECVLLPVCGGACPLAWSEGRVPCPSLKENAQERIRLAAALNGLTPVLDPEGRA